MAIPKVTTRSPRPAAIKGGTVPMPKMSQIRGKGMNAGGSPNDTKRLLPKSSSKVSTPKFSKGGKVGKPCGCR